MRIRKTMEKLVYTVKVNSKNCIGCQKFIDSAAMLTLQGYDKEFMDFFLSTKQLDELIESLEKVREENIEPDVRTQTAI